jgi:hypothetical protein
MDHWLDEAELHLWPAILARGALGTAESVDALTTALTVVTPAQGWAPAEEVDRGDFAPMQYQRLPAPGPRVLLIFFARVRHEGGRAPTPFACLPAIGRPSSPQGTRMTSPQDVRSIPCP